MFTDGRRTTYTKVMFVCDFEIFERWAHDCDVSNDAVEVEVALMLGISGNNQLFRPRVRWLWWERVPFVRPDADVEMNLIRVECAQEFWRGLATMAFEDFRVQSPGALNIAGCFIRYIAP